MHDVDRVRLETEVRVLRSHVHDLETRCDPAGDLRARRLAEENCDALLRQVAELEATIEGLRARGRTADSVAHVGPVCAECGRPYA